MLSWGCFGAMARCGGRPSWGLWVRLPACVFVVGRMTQYGALAIAARCIAHRSALRRALQCLAFDGRSGCGAGLRGFPGDVRGVCPLPLGCFIGRSVTALISGRPGKESAPVHSCVCPGALVVRGQSLRGQGRKAGQGCSGAEVAGRESPCGCLTACQAGLRSCHIRR